MNFKSFCLRGVILRATALAINFGSTISASVTVIKSSFGGDIIIIDFSAVPSQFTAGLFI